MSRAPRWIVFFVSTLVAGAQLGACRSLDIKDGALPCSKDKNDCPSPYTCVSGRCWSPDGSVSGAAGGGGTGSAAGSAAAGAMGLDGGGGSPVEDAGGAGAGTGPKDAGGDEEASGDTMGAMGAAGSAGGGVAGMAGTTGKAGASGGAGVTGSAGAVGSAGTTGSAGAGGTAPPPPPQTVTVSIQRSGQGTVTGTNINCQNASCPVTANVGASLTLLANAAQGWHLKQWSGCSTTSGPMCTLTNVQAATQVTATFVQDDANFAIVRDGNGSGTVTASWSGGGSLNCGATCSAAVTPGTQITLQATPTTGSTLQWGAPCSGSGSCTVTVAPGGTSITATFSLQRFLLTAALSGPAGAGNIVSTTGGVSINCGSSCSALVDYGTSVQLVASPAATGVFSTWSGCTSTSGTTCTSKVTSAMTVTAAFKSQTGASCSKPADCNLGFCVNNVCCASACNGVCDQSCAPTSGACLPKPARTPCGTATSSEPGFNDVALICDGAGKCAGPTITCGTSATSPSCATGGAMACCQRPNSSGAYEYGCRSVSSCAAANAA